jgi:hypothetical protein
VLGLIEARPFSAMAVLIAALLYLRLMASGPRLH